MTADQNNTTNDPLDQEEWRPIPGFLGYEVSNWGRVRSFWGRGFSTHGSPRATPTMMKNKKGKHGGYPEVHLRGVKGIKLKKVHNLVLSAFVGPKPENMECCHRDDDPANNFLYNLRWDTRSNNKLDAVRNGKHHCPQGENNPSSKLKDAEIVNIREQANQGKPIISIAEEFGVSKVAIRYIVKRINWKHVR